ncbi:MAG TPA: hypothetical protein VE988_25300 [Gemmataceae bacterium]|nr:hypothetical protein [Gemmataceae bacterium]
MAYNGETPPSNWLREQAAAGDQPFHWGGDWNTGLAEAGAEPDPAGYLLYPMAEEEWLESCATNTLFAAMEQPSEAQLAEFNLACCRRIRHLITDDITMQALEALERAADHATIPAELALAANQVESTFGPAQNESVAKAIGHAVCRCLPPGSFYYETDAVENARLVALYCQWAVGHAAEPAANDEGFDEEVDAAELGQTWLRQRAEQTEADAQCDLIRHLFTRRAD